MVDINIYDDMVNIKKKMYDEIDSITQGKKIEELSNEKLIELNNKLKEFNLLLEKKYEIQEEELDELKSRIKNNIKKLKNE